MSKEDDDRKVLRLCKIIRNSPDITEVEDVIDLVNREYPNDRSLSLYYAETLNAVAEQNKKKKSDRLRNLRNENKKKNR